MMMPRAISLVVAALVASVVAACGSSTGSGFGDGGLGPDRLNGGMDATTMGGRDGQADHAVTHLYADTGGGKCTPSTCSALAANCGTVTDPKCGGVVECGVCLGDETCGGGGVPNQCGTGVSEGGIPGDGCTHMTCASQSINCGPASDGCGATLSCGTCSPPQICGGNPMKPGQCGCTGTCAQVPTCDGGGTTTLTGKVYDPAVKYGLYNVLVYVPNNPSDPGLQPFAAGITCDVCGTTAAGDPLVSTQTAPDGTFTLTGVPVGASIPLVIQLGRWRRQFTVPIMTACGTNAVPDKTLSMPTNHTQGDLPRIAFVTGSLDPVECTLLKIGVEQSEFTNAGGGGYFQFFTADETGYTDYEGSGATLGSGTPTQDDLFAATGGPMNGPLINNYDMVIMECEGYEQPVVAAQETALAAYAAAGGRVFASDFQYTWMFESSPPPGWAAAFPGAANFGGNHSGAGYPVTASIDLPPSNPQGAAFQEWLEAGPVPGASSGNVSITPAFPNAPAVIAPTQEWLHTTADSIGPVHFTFNTPIGGAAANQCGRVTYSDWHAWQPTVDPHGTTFPGECPAGALTTQQAILEFMIFDLSACVMPYTPICTPQTCTSLGIECGPAGDGCGNLLQCGSCMTGMTCGGGGAGKCGTTTKPCMPETCASQNIQCGPAGDGCGNEIQCGNCGTGQVCGLNTAGQCGTPTSK